MEIYIDLCNNKKSYAVARKHSELEQSNTINIFESDGKLPMLNWLMVSFFFRQYLGEESEPSKMWITLSILLLFEEGAKVLTPAHLEIKDSELVLECVWFSVEKSEIQNLSARHNLWWRKEMWSWLYVGSSITGDESVPTAGPQWLGPPKSVNPGSPHFQTHRANEWPFQEPIDWRYLPYIRLIFQGYVREYPHKIWPEIWYSQYLHFRILEFLLSQWSWKWWIQSGASTVPETTSPGLR